MQYKILKFYLTGAINILPVPLYTFTRPSPEAAEPTNVLVVLSTVNCNVLLHAIAKLPSIFITSLSKRYII